MKREIKILTFCYLFTLLFLMISGKFGGILQIIIYISAFLAPTFIGISVWGKDEKRNKKEELGLFKIGKEKLKISVFLISPTLLAVLGASYLTSILMLLLFGKENTVSVSENALLATLIHAVLPSVLEELAFRYLPLKLLAKKSPMTAILLSGFFFSLIHRSFFQIPYAFLAGILFMAIDILTDSLLPSVIIHFLNNLLALMTMGVYGFVLDIPLLFCILTAASVLSLAFLFFERRRLALAVRSLAVSEEKYCFSPDPIFFAVPALVIALSELFI